MKDGRFIDIGYSSLRAIGEDTGVVVPLERSPDGLLTPSCRERLKRELRSVFPGKGPATCGVPAQGVSLRRFQLPRTPRDGIRALLQLRLEAEFPLPPEELAWGFSVREGTEEPVQEATVLALRSQVIEDYTSVLTDCGLRPSFGLSALAASRLIELGQRRQCVLDVGRDHSDVVLFEGGRPQTVRSLAWGGDRLTQALASDRGLSFGEAENVKLAGATLSPEVLDEAITPLARLLEDSWRLREARNGTHPGEVLAPETIFLCGGGTRQPGFGEALTRALGVPTETVPLPRTEEGFSAVTLGLEEEARRPQSEALRFLSATETETRRVHTLPIRRLASYGVAIVVLLLVSAVLRYTVPLLGLPGLEQRLEEARGRLAALPQVDPEIEFLEHVAKSQLPCLEALSAIAKGAPKGMLISEISLNRSGTISFQGTTKSFPEINKLRRQMAVSGWFENVVIQDVSKVQRKTKFRITAELTIPPEGTVLPAADEESSTESDGKPAAATPPENGHPKQGETKPVVPAPGSAAPVNPQPTTQPAPSSTEPNSATPPSPDPSATKPGTNSGASAPGSGSSGSTPAIPPPLPPPAPPGEATSRPATSWFPGTSRPGDERSPSCVL